MLFTYCLNNSYYLHVIYITHIIIYIVHILMLKKKIVFTKYFCIYKNGK